MLATSQRSAAGERGREAEAGARAGRLEQGQQHPGDEEHEVGGQAVVPGWVGGVDGIDEVDRATSEPTATATTTKLPRGASRGEPADREREERQQDVVLELDGQGPGGAEEMPRGFRQKFS